MIDAFGHLSYAVITAGMVLIGRDRASGWALRLAGDCGWFTLGIAMGMTSIWMWGFGFLLCDVIGWRKCRSRARLAATQTTREPAP